MPPSNKSLEALQFTNMPVSAAVVHTRAAFQSSLSRGLSVEELGRSPAAAEIGALWTVVDAKLMESQRDDNLSVPAPIFGSDLS